MDISLKTGKHNEQYNTTQTTKNTSSQAGLLQKYWNFCDRQMKHKYSWFLFPALILPCLFMPIAVYSLLTFGGAGMVFSIFLFVSMLLFIGGMVANVGGQDTRVTISLFLLAVVWNVFYPMLALLLF